MYERKNERKGEIKNEIKRNEKKNEEKRTEKVTMHLARIFHSRGVGRFALLINFCRRACLADCVRSGAAACD